MNINITESTTIKNGQTTVDGCKRGYTGFCNKHRSGISWDVEILITDDIGGIVDSVMRHFYFNDWDNNGKFRRNFQIPRTAHGAIAMALKEWRADEKAATELKINSN